MSLTSQLGHRLHAHAGRTCRCRWCAASARCSGCVLHTLARAAAARGRYQPGAVLSRQVAAPSARRIARETFVYVAQSWLDRSWLWHAPRDVVARRLTVTGGREIDEIATATSR